MKKVFYKLSMLIVAVMLLTSGTTNGVKDNVVTTDPFENGFVSPPDDQRVGCYWYWIDEKITREGVIGNGTNTPAAGIRIWQRPYNNRPPATGNGRKRLYRFL